MPAALKATFARLDELLAADASVSHAAKRESGAVGSLVHVDLLKKTVSWAHLGNAAIVLGQSVGSFASRQAEGVVLTGAGHSQTNAEERVRQVRRVDGSASSRSPQQQQQPGGVAVTRALGLLDAKHQQGGRDLITAEADLGSRQLTSSDQHVVLGTSAVWEVVPPHDAALRLYCCEKVGPACCSTSFRTNCCRCSSCSPSLL